MLPPRRARLWARHSTLAAVALAVAACGGSPNSPDEGPDGTGPRGKVVIISVDGLRPDAIQAAAPTIAALAGRGAFSLHARTIFPPVTLPSHTSMLTGFLPSAHGITWNSYRPESGYSRVPTVFARAREAGLRTVMVAGKTKMEQLNAPGTIDRFLEADTDAEAAGQAAGQSRSFDLMFVHLPDTDTAGHARGWMSPAYMAAVRDADRAVGAIVDALPEGTTVIVTADHGGHDTGHGDDRPEDMTIPWIMAGPNVVAGHQIQASVNTMDTAATALRVLGLSATAGASGRPVAEAFRSALASRATVRRPAA